MPFSYSIYGLTWHRRRSNRRAPATTESKNALKVSTGSMALGEAKRNGRCWLTASR
jgi:hypothetical protein